MSHWRPQISKAENPGKLTVIISFLQAKNNDTLTLEIGNKMADRYFLDVPERYIAVLNAKGEFHFQVPIKFAHGYFRLLAKRKFLKNDPEQNFDIVSPQFWERGDLIHAKISCHGFNNFPLSVYTGQGSEKYQARTEIDQIKENSIPFDGNIINHSPADQLSSLAQRQLAYLKKYEGKLTPLSYNILKADIIYTDKRALLDPIRNYYQQLVKANKEDSIKLFKQVMEKRMNDQAFGTVSFEGLENSLSYIGYCYRKYSNEAIFSRGGYSGSKLINLLATMPAGNTRDICLLYYFKTSRMEDDRSAQLDRAKKLMSTQNSAQLLDKYIKLAPTARIMSNYELTDINGKKIQLSDFKDKIVVVDFWFTGCGYCSLYYKNVLSKLEEEFKENNKVVFLSICVDKYKEQWSKSVCSDEYTSKRAVNVYTNGLESNHPIVKDNEIFGYPFLILLDRGLKVHAFNSKPLYENQSLQKEINHLLNARSGS